MSVTRVTSPTMALAAIAALVTSTAVGFDVRATEHSDGSFQRHVTTGEGPSPRSTPAVATVAESIYLFGGVRDDFRTNVNVFYDDLYRFDPVDWSWIRLHPAGSAPPPRAFAAAAGDGERMYVFGGAFYGPLFAGFTAFDDLWAYDASSDRWDLLDPHLVGGGPTGRSRPNMWLVDGDLYVFGGVTSTFETLNDLWRFDLDTRTWTEVIPNRAPGSPPTRHEAQAGTVAYDGRLVVYGGEAVELVDGAFFEILGDTWELDLDSRLWQDVTPYGGDGTPMPDPPRNYGAGGIVDSFLYLYGGDIPGGSSGCGAPFPQNTVDELWRFDLVNHRWEQLDPGGDPTVPLKRASAAVAGGRVWFFGGYDFQCESLDSPGQVWNGYVYSYDPPETAT